MAFQIKNQLSIVASMVNHVRSVTKKVTDFRVGSIVRSLLDAVAVEIDELYQRMFSGLKEAIPVAIYNSFGFEKLPASAAYVDVTFTASPAPSQAIDIPLGTNVRIPGGTILYATQYQVSIPVGQTQVSVRVVAGTTGTAGNTPSNTITEIVNSIPGVTVANPLAATSGRDEETDDERAARFANYIDSLSRGPLESVEYGAEMAVVTNAQGDVIEYVAKASVVEPYLTDLTQPIGYFDCYIYNGVGGTTNDLKTNAQKIIDGYYDTSGIRVIGYKAAGAICRVKLVAEQAVNVSVTVVMEDGFLLADVIDEITDAITTYIRSLPIGGTCVWEELIRVVQEVTGVYKGSVTAPAADVIPGANTQLIVGTITIV